MCGYACDNPDPRFLKIHIARKGHDWHKRRAHITEKRDVLRDKLESAQQRKPHVFWGDRKVSNCWQFTYLGHIKQPDGDHIPDVRRRIALAKSRAGQLRHILSSEDLELDLRLRRYVSACCSIMAYGSEAWLLDETTCRILNGANSYMLAHITGNPRKQEASPTTTTFNLIQWIRARRHRWLGHILRMQKDHRTNEGRLIKQAIRHIHEFRQQGDMLMDVGTQLSWDELQNAAQDRDEWRKTVQQLQMSAKGKVWKTSSTKTKQTRRHLKEQQNQTQLTSRFIYRAKYVVQPPSTARAKKSSNPALRQTDMEFFHRTDNSLTRDHDNPR